MLPTAFAAAIRPARFSTPIRHFSNCCGYTSTDELIGQHIYGLYAETDKWFDLADFLRAAAPFKGLTAEWKRKNGTTRWFASPAVP